MLISDAFDLYEKNYMAIRHRARRYKTASNSAHAPA